jgi:hypothetical protein
MQTFCYVGCRNQWIWRVHAAPTPQGSQELVRASVAAQAEYRRRLKQ